MGNNKKSRTLQLLPMEELQNRPCEVDGRPALFHRWVEEDRALLSFDRMLLTASDVEKITDIFRTEGLVAPGCSVKTIHETFALVEYRDGTVAKVKPELVRFVQEKIQIDGRALARGVTPIEEDDYVESKRPAGHL